MKTRFDGTHNDRVMVAVNLPCSADDASEEEGAYLRRDRLGWFRLQECYLRVVQCIGETTAPQRAPGRVGHITVE